MITAEFTNEINDLITENLYQWDTYQTLKISGIDFGTIAPRVHFANKKSTEALVVDAFLGSDGSVEVSIPNSLLTEKYDILAYVYINTGLTSKTIKSITIPIIARLKPSEYYQPSDEDIAQIEAIELEAKGIIDGLTASEFNLSENYKRPNIVYYNGSAYMCKSLDTIAGILPTSTAMWQKIVDGAEVTGVKKDSNGNLVFTFSNGKEQVVEMTTTDVSLIDTDEFKAFELTNDEVSKIQVMFEKVSVGKLTSYILDEKFNYLVYIPLNSKAYYARLRSIGSDIQAGIENDIKVETLTPGFHFVRCLHDKTNKMVYHIIDGYESITDYKNEYDYPYINTLIEYPDKTNNGTLYEFYILGMNIPLGA